MKPRLQAWLYPWDIADHGVDALSRLLRAADVETLDVAASYHSLFATVPDNPRRRLIDLPGTAVYFRPSPAVWEGSAVLPTVSPLVAQVGDALDLAASLARAAECEAYAWTVCLHDTAMGQRHHNLGLVTIWGDVIPESLCVRNPVMRDYLRRLVIDVSARADGVQLESANWMPLPHHRHVKVPAVLPDVVTRLAGLCFCEHCRAAAVAAGLDVDGLVGTLRSLWDAAHSGGAGAFTGELGMDEALGVFEDIRAGAVADLVRDLVAASEAPVEVVSFGDERLTGLRPADVIAAGASLRVLAYGPSSQVAPMLEGHAARLNGNPLHVGLSLLPEHSFDADDLVRSGVHARDAGAASIALYHLGLVDAGRREWPAALNEAIS